MTDIKWEAPPQAVNGKGKFKEVARELAARPGEWALIADEASSGLVSAINNGTGSWSPRGFFEAKGQTTGVNRSRVWARFVGEEA